MSTKLTYGDFTFDLPGDHDARESYLLQYGFAQSLQDSIAGKAKKWREETKDGQPVYNDAELAVMLHDAQQARFDAIVAGTVSKGSSGPRVTPIERIMKNVATEALRAAFAKAKKPMAKGDALASLVEQYLAKHGDKARAEAERRMEETADLADIEL